MTNPAFLALSVANPGLLPLAFVDPPQRACKVLAVITKQWAIDIQADQARRKAERDADELRGDL